VWGINLIADAAPRLREPKSPATQDDRDRR
jgi:hypothetical protein